ncbi:MAG: V-type ATP synthase subunit I [Brevinema sp.]
MAIAKMKKLTIAVSTDIKDALIDELQASGAVHIDALDALPSEDAPARDEWAKDLNPVLSNISSNEEIRRELALAISRMKELSNVKVPSFEVTSSETIDRLLKKHDPLQLSNHFRALDRETRDSEALVAVLKNEHAVINRWASVVDDFDPIQQKSATLRGVVGQISESALEDFKLALAQATPLSDVLVVYTQDKEAFCYVIASIDVWDSVNLILKEKPFNVLQLTRRSGNTVGILNTLEDEIEVAVDRHNKALAQWADYADKIDSITLIHDAIEMDLQKQKAHAMALASDSVTFFRAWVPEEALPKVSAQLSKYKTIDVLVEDPSEDEYETVPVSLKNNGLTRPFSALTTMYGTPMYGATVDPTPHLTPFYFVYYGFCFGDFVYGSILAAFSLYMMFKNRANKAGANFYALLAWSGFSGMIAGVLFGSYAGDLFTNPNYFHIPILDTLRISYSDGSAFFDKPLIVLFISLALGAVQLWYGYFIKFLMSLKKDLKEALFCNLPWMILLSGFFLWAILSWIASMAGLNLISDKTLAKFFLTMKIGAVLIILNAMRLGFQKGPIQGILGSLGGLWELYSISSYLSNLLSYARLLALGLSSGIIANVFNQLALGMAKSLADITPILSVFGLALLIFLHLFNLVLGGFGAFVHALRLQFVEFFGQFMEGGGKEYSPLKREGSHYMVK